MNVVVTDSIGTAFLAIPVDPVPHLAKAGEGFDVAVDQIPGSLPLLSVQ